MIAHLTLKKSLLPIKKGLPLNIVYNLWKPDGSIGHCLLNTVSKNSLELHLLQKRYEANLDKTEKINIPNILLLPGTIIAVIDPLPKSAHTSCT